MYFLLVCVYVYTHAHKCIEKSLEERIHTQQRMATPGKGAQIG